MEPWNFADGNIVDLLETRRLDSSSRDVNHGLQMHSSLVQRLALEKEIKGHNGCVNTIAWNSKGTLLISGSDDTRINIWSYSSQELIHSIDTGHATNIFCTKFIPETSDNLVASGAGDAEVRLFNVSRSRGVTSDEILIDPSAVFQCHSRRVKKLAVEVGNPNVVWSASEDGTLRQHDMREGSSCPRAGSQECRSVLLDLRCGAKRSLNSSPNQCLSLKSCDISSTRPHQILVGGSDAFARLYDRRMLPSLSSCRTKMPPPPCVCYFCPMHLSERRRSIHLTHVTFSPDGREILLSYSGEHVYLMDISGDQRFQYVANDALKLFSLTTTSDESESFSVSTKNSCNFAGSKSKQRRLDMYRKLVQNADKILNEGSNFLYGIEACNEILDGKGPEIGDALKHDCLCIRAALLLKRKWKNDVHMAIKDCVKARNIIPSSFKAHYLMSEALEQLEKYKEALEYALATQHIAPNSSTSERVSSIRDQIAAAEARKKSKENSGNKKGDDTRKGRVRSLSDVLFRSELNNEESREGEREDSEFEGELEVDFETSVSGDEAHDTESSILHGRVNVRYHRSDDSNRDSCSTNGSQGSPSSSQQGHVLSQPESAIDMKQRYVGHCNIGTDIKQASFLGQKGEFVASGSDDGRWFIWEKSTGRLIKMLTGDKAVVNCIQCHPFDCAVATSGIDNTIKLWSPQAEVPSLVAGGAAGPETADVLSVIESNQSKLGRHKEGIFLEPLTVHDLEFAGVHPFECAQS